MYLLTHSENESVDSQKISPEIGKEQSKNVSHILQTITCKHSLTHIHTYTNKDFRVDVNNVVVVGVVVVVAGAIVVTLINTVVFLALVLYENVIKCDSFMSVNILEGNSNKNNNSNNYNTNTEPSTDDVC